MQHERGLQVVTGPIARIRGGGGRICGTGFLIGDRHVMTCAHVIDDVAGRDRGSEDQPDIEVTLDLPFLDRRGLVARIVAWKPMRSLAGLEEDPVSDITVLELAEPVPGGVDSRNARLSVPPPGTPFITWGFPAGMDNGAEAGGELRLTDAGGWRQIRDVQDHGYFVEPGFSGAPIFDASDGKLLGMVTAADQDKGKRLAFLIPTPTLCQAWPLLAKPYNELFSFTEEDADLFFGREAVVDEIRAKLDDKTFLTVIGPSGSGKSSVVKAGLIPRLRQEGGWAIVNCRPGRRPLYRLAHALEELSAGPTDTAGGIARRATELETLLREDSARLPEHVETMLAGLPGIAKLLIVIDQFEELFTHDDPERVGAEAAQNASDRQRAFSAVLGTIGKLGRKAPLRAIATLRADFTGRALQDETLANLLRDADVKLGPMSANDLALAVENPAQRFGVGFDPGLVPQIVTETVGRAGSLPLLQFALSRLWGLQEERVLKTQAYDGFGGVKGALSQHANDVYDRLDDEERAQVRRILTRLVRLGSAGEQSEDTRAVVSRAEIGETDWPMAQTLADERLITTGQDRASGEETAEVIHEALIRAWPKLREWLDQDREFGLWRQRLKGDVARWDGSNQDALLRGDLLAEAKVWLASHTDDLNDAEQGFIDASADRAQVELLKLQKDKEDRLKLLEEKNAALATNQTQQKKSLRSLSALAIALLIATIGIGYFAWQRNAELGRAVAAEETAKTARQDADEARAETEEALLIAKRNGDLASQRADMLDEMLEKEKELNRITDQARYEAEEARAQAESDRDLAVEAIDLAEKQRNFAQENEKRAETAAAEALAAAREAKGRQLSYDASILMSGVGGAEAAERAAAFAIESWRLRPDVQSYQVAVQSMLELPLHRIEHRDSVRAIAFSPDGTLLATASFDGTARILDASTGAEIARIEHWDWVTAVAFSPDSARLATASRNGSARILDAQTGQEIARVDHGDVVAAVAFSPDGTRLATASSDGTARILDAKTGEEIARIEHGASVYEVAFSPDGTRLATASADGFAGVFDADPARIFQRLCELRTGRNLTQNEWDRYIGDIKPWRPTCPQWRNADN